VGRGVRPATGAPKGRVRTDAAAVRSWRWWSTDPSRGRWPPHFTRDRGRLRPRPGSGRRAGDRLAGPAREHAGGAAGYQVQVPVQEIEAAVVRHYTSRAGDPHRHLHLQINARVLAEDTWRGLHTVGVRDSLGAINGIGHAAVICDPDFRAALADRGSAWTPAAGDRGAGGVCRALQCPRSPDRPQRGALRGDLRLAHRGPNPARR